LLDTLRVFAIRIFKGCSPFTPDRNHVHHLFLNRGLGHAAITLICVSINIGFVVLAYSLRSIGSTYLLLIMLALSFTGFGLLYYGKPRHTMTIAKRMNGTTELKTTSKVVTLTQETATADHS
jgi:UDP-GlcNAc:undecaprenyl-phosphate/decaprenyl-phosphate GlcNAc-1-phosphate transferase